ncbi:MAG: SEC-C domain-containing protein [Pirellulales bacterium]|nr:SEC-C domain-containing protein [Pirellulales bacterium]
MARTTTKKQIDPNLPVFQLEITLQNSRPKIWRRIQTHDCTLDELHCMIQSCMEWEDDHLHVFEVGKKQYADLGDRVSSNEFRDSNAVRLSALAGQKKLNFIYEYDFGDSWRHEIVIEDTLPAEDGVRYPRCLDGRRAGPPEDCGGVWGYYRLLEILSDPDHEEHEEQLEWLGDDFDPEEFDVEQINERFSRLRRWLGHRRIRREQTALFSKKQRVRVKDGVMHRRYEDIPLGGWTGTVRNIAWLIPISFEVGWTPETLENVHSVYAKRCKRDDESLDTYWLDEEDLEPVSPDQPVVMQQPGNLLTRPLSPDDGDDRVRMALGLSSDDPIPPRNAETLQQFCKHLQGRLVFPFDADWYHDTETIHNAQESVEIVGLVPFLENDEDQELLCEVRVKGKNEVIRVLASSLFPGEEDPNCVHLQDYRYWLWHVLDEEAMGKMGDDDENSWEYNAGFDGEDDDFDEEEPSEWMSDFEIPTTEPIHRVDPPVGRNEPCPCGSGKKFKKCCLKKRIAE